jgi:hypothetical protein
MNLQAREPMMWLRRWRRGESSVLLATAMLALFVLASSSNACLATPFASTSLTISATSFGSSAPVSDAVLSEAVLQWLETSMAASASSASSGAYFGAGIETPRSIDANVDAPSLQLTPYHIAHAMPPTAIAPPQSLSSRAAAHALPLHEAASRSGIRTNSFPQ